MIARSKGVPSSGLILVQNDFHPLRKNRTLRPISKAAICGVGRARKWHTIVRRFQVLKSSTPVQENIVERIRRVEAVLFLAREPLNSRKIGELADLADGTEARTLIRKLNRQYDLSGRAYRAESVAGGYLLMTRPSFANWLRKLHHVPRQLRLTPPAIETLSVVAYRQPVTRAEIESIRGVACGDILRQLMERDLVRISGRSEELGRPFLYSTTKHFLKSFGLNNLETLPGSERLRQPIQVADSLESADGHDSEIRDSEKQESEEQESGGPNHGFSVTNVD